jgi:GTP cyclohydrolase I
MNDESINKIMVATETIIQTIGEDLSREGLQKTPLRFAKAMSYLTSGYTQNVEEVTNDALFANTNTNDTFITVKNIEFYSLCEHHMVPFFGKVHISYIHNGKVLGLSKFARIVDMFSRRLQIQENLTHQIGEAIYSITGAKGVGVTIEAQHMCMMMRGVQKQNSSTVTTCLFGICNDKKREEYYKTLG